MIQHKLLVKDRKEANYLMKQGIVLSEVWENKREEDLEMIYVFLGEEEKFAELSKYDSRYMQTKLNITHLKLF